MYLHPLVGGWGGGAFKKMLGPPHSVLIPEAWGTGFYLSGCRLDAVSALMGKLSHMD